MNWKTIKQEYPKAFKELIRDHEVIEEWGNIDNPKIWGELIEEPHYILRHLFDFFDNKGIFIDVLSHDNFMFSCGIEKYQFISNIYSKRKDAENEAFIKAFEILNSNL